MVEITTDYFNKARYILRSVLLDDTNNFNNLSEILFNFLNKDKIVKNYCIDHINKVIMMDLLENGVYDAACIYDSIHRALNYYFHDIKTFYFIRNIEYQNMSIINSIIEDTNKYGYLYNIEMVGDSLIIYF